MQKVTKEIKKKKEKSQMDKLIILNDYASKQRIINLRNEGVGRSWSEVTSIFNAEMDSDYTIGAIQNAYENEMSLEIQIDGNKEKLFSDNIDKVKERYDRVSASMDKYQVVVDKLVDEAADMDSYDLLEKVDDIFRVGKQIEVVYKMVDKQIGLLLSEQEKISIKASKNNKKGLTEAEVVAKFKVYLPEVLKSLEIQGKLKIVDTSLLK